MQNQAIIETYDYAVIGAGIIGMSIARELKQLYPQSKILILEKESDVGLHASGRNSGVLHAGFYYSADSLKARFTKEGNRLLKAFCKERSIPILECGKLVVTQSEEEIPTLRELKSRGEKNGVELDWITEWQAQKIDPNARTVGFALYSPSTAVVDPKQVCRAMREELKELGVNFQFGSLFRSFKNHVLLTSRGSFEVGFLINSAGLYADRVAHSMGIAPYYTLLPFKGVYLKEHSHSKDFPSNTLKTNIYPVPHLGHPFLGVHFTQLVDGGLKIGPTAIPAFWRENYSGLKGFRLSEFLEVLSLESRLWIKNSFGFRKLALEEFKKYFRGYLARLASRLVQNIEVSKRFTHWSQPGIRAQLLDRRSMELVNDFVVEKTKDSLHMLNAVSPAFTCSLAIAQHVCKDIQREDLPNKTDIYQEHRPRQNLETI